MWFSVRNVLSNGPVYEERVTMWDAQDFEAAHILARNEAEAYSEALHDGKVLDLFQVYRLFDEPADQPGVFSAIHGAEVFSLIRESELDPPEYLRSFFDTGLEQESRRVRIFGGEPSP